MENKKKHPAVKMKAKRAKLLAKLKYCCIPATKIKTEIVEYEDGTKQVVNPKIKPNGNGPFGKASDDYKELRAERKKYLRNNFRQKKRRKQPWYMLTRGKCYNYEQRKEPYGSRTDYFKVESEYAQLYKRIIVPKFTREELIIRLLSAKMNDWEKKDPMPSKEDLFYWEEIKPWVNRYQATHSRVAGKLGLLSLKKIPKFVEESYHKYDDRIGKEYNEYWNKKMKAA